MRLIAAFVLAICLFSCTCHSEHWETLAQVESYIEERPDSALSVLGRIDASELSGREEMARYALLYSMALDKNYIDTTTFDVLQPAIDYYIEHGTSDEQLRTYYYQGRIYQNKGDYDAAMQSFMNATDLRQIATDSLLLAHTLVAQGTLYYKQYKIKEFIHNNLEAAVLYGAIGRHIFEIHSYTNALDGNIMLNNKSGADSILSICVPLVKENPDGETYLFPSLVTYTVNFCSPEVIKAFLDKYQDVGLTREETMGFAYGYSRIGDYDKAMTLLSGISPAAQTLDSLKYLSVKLKVLEKQGKYEQAFALYNEFSSMLGRLQNGLLSQDLLFANKKHQLEVNHLTEIRNRDRIIFVSICSILALIILVGWLFYYSYRNKTKRFLANKECETLRLEQANLKLEIAQLESERDNLKELQREQSELAAPIQDVIKNRLDMLNGLLAKEITNNESYAAQYNEWIDTVHKDKKKFMDSTRLAFTASHPKFMAYLERHGLSIDEINYLCLYAIGLRGKEVGEYIQLKRHYIISHEIRQKLCIDEHETNMGLYVRRLMTNFEK